MPGYGNTVLLQQKVYFYKTRDAVIFYSMVESMLVLFFIIGIIGTLFLFIFINLELNALRKKVDNLILEIKKHYEIE